MIYSLSFISELEEDTINGYNWYEEKVIGLDEDFRRCLLRRFPYAIYYRIEKDKIIVYGLFHCARSPKILKKNLRIRKLNNP